MNRLRIPAAASALALGTMSCGLFDSLLDVDDRLGGTPVGAFLYESNVGGGVGWNSAGSEFIFETVLPAGRAVVAVPPAGQTERIVTMLPSPEDRSIAVSAEALYLTVPGTQASRGHLVRVPLAGGTRDTLALNIRLPLRPAIFTPDERFIAYIIGSPAAVLDSVEVLDRETGTRRGLRVPGLAHMFDLAPDGSAMVYYRTDPQPQVMVIDVDTRVETLITGIAAGGTNPETPWTRVAWRPAGPRVAVSRVAFNADLWVVDHPGAPSRHITRVSGGNLEPLGWLNDGARLLVAENVSTGRPTGTVAIYDIAADTRSVVEHRENTYVLRAVNENVMSNWPGLRPDEARLVVRTPKGFRLLSVP